MPRWSPYGVLLVPAFVALALIAWVHGVLGAALQLSAGLLLVCAGIGFVLAPLLRRRAGDGAHPLRHGSFWAGLAATLAGAAITGYALWHLVTEQVSIHVLRTFAS
jgi:uncharacterized protein YjeT (DUF2065 family)